jgi:hypothetical protein
VAVLVLLAVIELVDVVTQDIDFDAVFFSKSKIFPLWWTLLRMISRSRSRRSVLLGISEAIFFNLIEANNCLRSTSSPLNWFPGGRGERSVSDF